MITVIRIEYLDGNGIFSAKDEKGYLLHKKLNCKNKLEFCFYFFPSPKKDNKICRNPLKNEYCGFLSLADMNYHLNPDLIYDLIKTGFKIYIMQVKTGVLGEFQILYKKEDIVSKKDITYLFTH